MRKLFPGYYRPTDEEFRAIWTECTFAFDANVLLNLYRYTPETRDKFLDVLRRLQDRIWIPHRAAFEYQRNRLRVIAQQERAYDDLVALLTHAPAAVQADFSKSHARHVLIQVSKVLGGLKSSADAAIAELEAARAKHPKYSYEQDSIRDALDDLFESRVGPSDNPAGVLKAAMARFADNRPPGTKDKPKGGTDQYGDAIIWLELLEFAKSTAPKPLVYVTDDRKDDWWDEFAGKTLGPRSELVQEMASSAGATYYQYKPDVFLDYATEMLGDRPAETAVDEIRAVEQASADAEELRLKAATEAARRALFEEYLASAQAAREEQRQLARAVGSREAFRELGLSTLALSDLGQLGAGAAELERLAVTSLPGDLERLGGSSVAGELARLRGTTIAKELEGLGVRSVAAELERMGIRSAAAEIERLGKRSVAAELERMGIRRAAAEHDMRRPADGGEERSRAPRDEGAARGAQSEDASGGTAGSSSPSRRDK